MRRSIIAMLGLVAAAALAANPAYACKGKKEIFKADMDDMPFGDLEFLTYDSDSVTVKPPKGKVVWPAVMLDDDVSGNIDLCITVKLMKAASQGGLSFWGMSGEKWIAVFDRDGNTIVGASANGKWTNQPSKKGEMKKNAENVIRLTLKGKEGTLYLNDTKLQTFRRKMEPDDTYEIGIAAQNGDVQFSEFRGTSVD